jgi:2-polyprenyl-6-methoxyphenol hydroxylase-like FAD-dependent oxidoreductase
MSPVGGVGINLAIQDAVAAANVLAEPLRQNRLTFDDLKRVQARREFPTLMTQNMQVFMQSQMIAPALAGKNAAKPPLPMRILLATPFLKSLPARFIGMGVRPEHVAQTIRDATG